MRATASSADDDGLDASKEASNFHTRGKTGEPSISPLRITNRKRFCNVEKSFHGLV
jgi:hypothetical protein